MESMQVNREARTWRIGTAAEVAWLAGRPTGTSMATAMPQIFEANGTL